jgi:hypothetical protein
MRRNWIFIIPAAIAGLVVFAFIGGQLVRLLWNWLLPSLAGLPEITFWQALGILALSRILVGGFGMHGRSSPGGMREHFHHRRVDRVADRVAHHWQHMSQEERERFRQRLREHGVETPFAEGAGMPSP